MTLDRTDFLTRAEVANLLRLNPATVRRYERSGKLPVIRFAANKLLYKRADVLALIQRCTVQPTA